MLLSPIVQDERTCPASSSDMPNCEASTFIPVGSKRKCQLVMGCSKIKSAFISGMESISPASVPLTRSYIMGSWVCSMLSGMFTSMSSITTGMSLLRPRQPRSTNVRS